MASSSLESHTIYACGIESRFVKVLYFNVFIL
ncbi:hypothetical protein TrispH2_011787, partial [Trichoplax sp. H2]